MDQHKETSENSHLTEAEYYKETAEKHRQEVTAAWKTFGKTGVFVLAAAVVFILICLGWFVQNSQVTSGSGAVSARQNVVRFASKGYRQEAETDSTLELPDGSKFEYESETYYYTENDEIAMRLSENYHVSPGASGSIDFYLIPVSSGARTVTLSLELAGYYKNAYGMSVPAKDEVLNKLLKGHILLFENYENGFYSGWLYNQDSEGVFRNTFSVTLPENAEADVPYHYSIYWIWPKRYENLVSHRPGNQDLYADSSEEFQVIFLPFVYAQASKENAVQIGKEEYRYSTVFLSDKWPLAESTARTKAYNLADEYIGTKADDLYLKISIAS